MATAKLKASCKPSDEGQRKRQIGAKVRNYSRSTTTSCRRSLESSVAAYSFLAFSCLNVIYPDIRSSSITATPQFSQEEQGRASPRGASFSAEGACRGFKDSNPPNACSSCQFGQEQEGPARLGSGTQSVASIMEHLSGRRHSALAEVCGGLPSTRQRAHQADRRGEGFIADQQGIVQTSTEYYGDARDARGDFRRRCIGAASQAPGAHGQDGSHAPGDEEQRRAGDCTTGTQKATHRRKSGSYGGCHYYRRRRPAAFCGGRQVSGTTIPCQSPLALRWTHTIVTATDFITSWEAADSAYFLAFDLGNVPLYASGSSHTPSRCTKRSQVRFDNDICVCLYHETITSQHSVSHESLQDPLKPWRLFPAQPDDRSAIPLSDWPGMIPAQQQIDLRHPFHAFMTDLSPLFEAGATTELLEEGPIAYIATWFLNHDPPGIKGLGPRPVRLNNDPLDWGEDILDAWSDILPLLPGQPNCDIVVVHPTPENGVATNYASHVILSVFGRPEQAGLLLTSTVGGGVEHAAWPVLHHRTTVHDVELWSGSGQPIAIGCAWDTVTGQQPLPVIHGEGCVAISYIPEDESDEASLQQLAPIGTAAEPPHPHVLDRCCGVVDSQPSAIEAVLDDVSLMQRPEPSQAPSLQQTHIIGLHLPIAPVVIDSEQPMLVNLADFWPYYPKPFHDVIALHPVHDPPTFAHLDALPKLIAQRDSDRFEQEQTDDVLALISVSLHAPHTSSHRRQRLKVLWVPARGTRANYVDFFRMTVHCRQATTLCFMYHNNVLWPRPFGAWTLEIISDYKCVQMVRGGTIMSTLKRQHAKEESSSPALNLNLMKGRKGLRRKSLRKNQSPFTEQESWTVQKFNRVSFSTATWATFFYTTNAGQHPGCSDSPCL